MPLEEEWSGSSKISYTLEMGCCGDWRHQWIAFLAMYLGGSGSSDREDGAMELSVHVMQKRGRLYQ